MKKGAIIEQSPVRWAILFNGTNVDRPYYSWRFAVPSLFFTKREAQAHIKEHYGYIAKRKDLRSPPHNWRMPKPVKVYVHIVSA